MLLNRTGQKQMTAYQDYHAGHSIMDKHNMSHESRPNEQVGIGVFKNPIEDSSTNYQPFLVYLNVFMLIFFAIYVYIRSWEIN